MEDVSQDSPQDVTVAPLAQTPPPRGADGRLLPGRSLNPTGRSKEPRLKDLIASKCGGKSTPALVDYLLSLIESPNQTIPERKLALAATELLLAYAHGRPHQSATLTGADGGPVLPVIIHHHGPASLPVVAVPVALPVAGIVEGEVLELNTFAPPIIDVPAESEGESTEPVSLSPEKAKD